MTGIAGRVAYKLSVQGSRYPGALPLGTRMPVWGFRKEVGLSTLILTSTNTNTQIALTDPTETQHQGAGLRCPTLFGGEGMEPFSSTNKGQIMNNRQDMNRAFGKWDLRCSLLSSWGGFGKPTLIS